MSPLRRSIILGRYRCVKATTAMAGLGGTLRDSDPPHTGGFLGTAFGPMLYHQTRVMVRGGPLDSHSWRASRRFRAIYFASAGVPPCWGRHDAAHRLDSEASWRRQGESS